MECINVLGLLLDCQTQGPRSSPSRLLQGPIFVSCSVDTSLQGWFYTTVVNVTTLFSLYVVA